MQKTLGIWPLPAVLLCSFHATIYPCPENAAERERQKEELATKLQEASTVRCCGTLLVWCKLIAATCFNNGWCFDTVG